MTPTPEISAAQKKGQKLFMTGMALVMGGMIVSDVVMMPNEDPSELFKALSHALEIRMGECAEDDPIFIMSVDILSRTGQKYGIKLS